MNFNLNDSTVWLVLAGSRAYGTFTENSDYDFRGIAIPPLYHYTFDKFEQTTDKKDLKHIYKYFPELNIPENSEFQIMELTKFVLLALDNNPNVLEILFCENIWKKHFIFNKLLDVRDSFLSRRAKARFAGYANSQLARAKNHKRYLDNPPLKTPERKDFGLPEYTLLPKDQLGAAQSLIDKEVHNYCVDQSCLPEEIKVELEYQIKKMLKAVWQGIHVDMDIPVGHNKTFKTLEDGIFNLVIHEQNFSDNFIELLRRERAYRLAKQDWNNYQTWLKERNPERAILEKKYGIDLKHVMHLIRLLAMAREITTEGKLIVLRPNSKELKDIRSGKAFEDGTWSYEKIIEFAEKENEELNKLVINSPLPEKPNDKLLKQIAYEMIMEFNGK